MAAARVILVSDTLAKQELIEPDGLEQHTVTVDLPDPYPQLTSHAVNPWDDQAPEFLT